MALYISSNSAQIVMTAIYGTAATGIGVVGIYQGHRAWVTRHAHHPDLELGQSASQPTDPTSGSTEGGATRGSSPTLPEEHPVAASIPTQADDGDHVIDDQNHAQTLSPRREASLTQSLNPPPHITIEGDVVAA